MDGNTMSNEQRAMNSNTNFSKASNFGKADGNKEPLKDLKNEAFKQKETVG